MKVCLPRPATSLQIDHDQFGRQLQGCCETHSLVPMHTEHDKPMAAVELDSRQHDPAVDLSREVGEQKRVAPDVAIAHVEDVAVPIPCTARSRAQSFADGSPTAQLSRQSLRCRLETFDPFEMPLPTERAQQSDCVGFGLPPLEHDSPEHFGEHSYVQTEPVAEEYQMMCGEQEWPRGAHFQHAGHPQLDSKAEYFHEAGRPQLQAEHFEVAERFWPQLPAAHLHGAERLQLQPQQMADWVRELDRPQSRLQAAEYKTMDPMDLPLGSSTVDISLGQIGQPRISVSIDGTEAMESRLQTCPFKSFDPFEDQPIDLSRPAPEEVKQSIQQLLRMSVQKKFSQFEACNQPIVQPSSGVSQNSTQDVGKKSLEVDLEVESAEDSGNEKTLCPRNPGSAGHPEVCSRICIYFPLGTCENGDNCGYCHCSHANSRSANLDKGSREHLQSLHYLEAYRIIMPVLKKKVHALRLGPEFLAGLAAPLHVPTMDAQDSERQRKSRRLSAALAKMSLRALLSNLKKIMPEGTLERVAGDMLLQRINDHCRTLVY